MILSNVNIGTGPSSGDGSPLRSAFAIINTNFQIITNNVNALSNSVTSVAGRTGNVVLTVNDIVGFNPANYSNVAVIGSWIAANINAVTTGETTFGNLVPSANVTYSLGNVTHQWKELWVSNNTIYLNGTPLSVDNAGDLLVNGNPVGGGAITGNITVGNCAINFVANSSGDGIGLSTIELRPDTNLNSDQYLIIDPTYPTHIHIRAGGTQDASTAELYLGAENNHVRVRDGIGVKLQNDLFTTNFYNFQQGVDYDTASWSIDESNNTWLDIYITNPMNPTRSTTPFDVPFYSFTQFPQNRIEVFDGTNYIDLAGNGQAFTLGNPYQLRIGVTPPPGTNPTAISSLTFRVDTLTQSALLLENNTFDLSVNQDAFIYADQTIQLTTGVGNFRITTDDNNGSYSWYFTAQGYLQFPQGLGPTTSKGQDGDEAGSVVFDGNYIYYCTTDWTDGVADIWRRVAWSNDTW